MSKNTGGAAAKNETSNVTALDVKKPDGGAVLNLEDAMDFAADAGHGMEGVDKDSVAIPFLQVLQGLSPQCETVDGAKPGLLINTITNELSSEFLVIPVAFQRRYNRWVPRSKGGGFKGDMSVAEVEALRSSGIAKEVEDEKTGAVSLKLEDDDLVDTRNHFVLLVNEETGGVHPAIISLAKTHLKRSKRWMALQQNLQMFTSDGRAYTPPSFSHMYVVTTEKESNEKGSWYSPVFKMRGPVRSASIYKAAKDFHAQVVSGAVKAGALNEEAYPVGGEEGAGDGDSKQRF